MNRFRASGLLPSLLLLWGAGLGCHDTKVPTTSPSPPPPAATNTPAHLDHAQPRLRTLQLFIGPHEITAEVALTRTEVATGMMFRETMEEMEGMLFVFPVPHQTGFYMKNTRVPLTAAYIDADGNVLELHDLEPFNETPVEATSDQVQYVLEMKQGWFLRHSIGVGAFIRTERGTLRETFFGGRP